MNCPYENIYNKKENLESTYNFLKCDDEILKKSHVKKIIDKIENQDSKEDSNKKRKDKNKNIDQYSDNSNSENFNITGNENFDKRESEKNEDEISAKEDSSDKKDEKEAEINFDEFQNYFIDINKNKNTLKDTFIEGFAFIDKNKKGFIDIDDIRRINNSLFNHFSEEDLQVLVDIVSKTDSKITFDDFMEFLNDEN